MEEDDNSVPEIGIHLEAPKSIFRLRFGCNIRVFGLLRHNAIYSWFGHVKSL
jgi:hypothetical protein